jgi:hypothetical protein
VIEVRPLPPIDRPRGPTGPEFEAHSGIIVSSTTRHGECPQRLCLISTRITGDGE